MSEKSHHYYDFDVIVVGGGHAGIEASYAAARMGSRTLLVTIDKNKIGLMPCNPAIGGVGKGHIVYEISALGGLMPQLCTQTYLQARMLNTRKGPAVQGLRLQIDKFAYNKLSIEILSKTENLTILDGKVAQILVSETPRCTVYGILTESGINITAPTIIITTGTFLNGKIHIGKDNYAAGRRDEEAVVHLSHSLQALGLSMGRLKTGTPPRLLTKSLNFDKMQVQPEEQLDHLFEFYPHQVTTKAHCYITHTNEQTHAVIKKNLSLSAMYNGNIKGVGPRYCPSIEDKIGRFPDKSSHHVFVEPEGADCDEVYPNGISTSLPLDVQREYVRTIVGFEEAIITKAGYAVEYDFVFPHQLKQTLETIAIEGLFLAGQINGTTGYEEAAGQGIIAGINAHLKNSRQEPFIIDRTLGYIGVMINDLVTLSVDEPYRMFTSRAERRLLLRQDNAFSRLTDKAYQLGLIDHQLYKDFSQEKKIVQTTLHQLRTNNLPTDLFRLYGQSSIDLTHLRTAVNKDLSSRAAYMVHAEIRYQPYLVREQEEVNRHEQFKHLIIPDSWCYDNIPGLSKELQAKLTKHKPGTIAQAALVPGITPAALSLLIFRIRSKKSIESPLPLTRESNFF